MSSPEGRRIKVLIALEGVLGGTLRHIDYILRFADASEFDIHLAISAERAEHVRDDFRRWEAAGWRVHEIPMRREITPFADVRAFCALLDLCGRERYHVVHTHCAKAGFLGRLAARMTGARTIHTAHVFPFSHDLPDVRRGLYVAMEKLAAKWTDRFVLLSNYQLNLMLAVGLGPPERAVVVPNGIVPEEFVGPSREVARHELGLGAADHVALFAGRFCEQKGLEVLLSAARLLAEKAAGVCILAVGEGPLESWLARRVSAQGLGGVISLQGRTDRMPLYYAACDVVLLPSRAEGMPYVLLEAKAAARPVVAALVTGMEEFVTHGKDGFLVPADNGEALADVLQNAFARPELLARVGENARSGFRDEWRAEHATARVCDLYRELAAM